MGYAGTFKLDVRSDGGFYPNLATGTDLPSAERGPLARRVDQARALAEAIGSAMAAARAAQLGRFEPASSLLQMPDGLGASERDALFLGVVGVPFTGAALDLQQWAQAAERLQQWAASRASQLPPAAGGGAQYVQGTWYVNGQAVSLGQLFTATRVNTYESLDKLINSSLDTIAANNNRVRAMSDFLKVLSKKGQQNDWASYPKINTGWLDAVGVARQDINGVEPSWLYVKGNSYRGYTFVSGDTSGDNAFSPGPRTYGVTIGELGSLGRTVLGDKSMFYQMSITDWNVGGVTKDGWNDLMNELQTLIDSKTGDNQIAQQRLESVMNVRSNLLDGLTNMLKGQQNLASTASRNL